MRVVIRSWKEWNNLGYSSQDQSLTGQSLFVTLLSMLSPGTAIWQLYRWHHQKD
jgi:hypothetical protein